MLTRFLKTIACQWVLAVVVFFPLARAHAADQKPPESRWETAIQAFEASDKTNPPPRNAILFIGSSSILKWDTLAQDFPGYKVIKRGFDDTEPARQRYECHACHTRFDDLTDTIFAGHHQPLKVWVLCLYFMGLNLSNEQIAHEWSINESDAYQMTTALRGGIVKKSRQ